MIRLFKRRSPHFFLSRKERKILREKTEICEKKTGCEIVFHVRGRLASDAVLHNRKLFHQHGLHESEHKRGILISLALRQRKFAVWVDEGVEKHNGEVL